jgi:hypothetical protein
MRKFVYIFVLLLGLQTACGRAPGVQTPQPAISQATQVVTSQPADVESAATEAPQAQAATSLPPVQSPTSTQPPSAAPTPSGSDPTVITTLPAPGADTGVVTGSVFSTNVNAPLSSVGVYLGEYMYLTPGPDYMITMREQGSPHTLADANGRFVIDKVPPGKYPILLWTPFNSKVVPDAEAKKELVVTVEAGKVTDLGEIRIEFP